MFAKQIIILFFSVIFNNTNARIMKITKGGSCHCRSRIQRERNEAIKKQNEVVDNFNKLNEFVTLKNCNEGYSFNYESSIDTKEIVCDKCPKNNYRTSYNSTCLQCPKGYVSEKGSKLCKKGKKEELLGTEMCHEGTIVGNNPFANYDKSCIKCNTEKKEYMPNKNFEDKCLVCSDGSIVQNNKCIKCPVGTYENNNKCIECDIGKYNNIEGSVNCIKCNNIESFAYYSIGGNNCDDSYLFSISNKINKIINIKNLTDPLIYSVQITSGMIYNHRKMIVDLGTKFTIITSGFGISTYILFASP
jgi:hypothetical protein